MGRAELGKQGENADEGRLGELERCWVGVLFFFGSVLLMLLLFDCILALISTHHTTVSSSWGVEMEALFLLLLLRHTLFYIATIGCTHARTRQQKTGIVGEAAEKIQNKNKRN